MSHTLRTGTFLLALSAVLAVAGSAQAQPMNGTSIWGIATYWDGVGIGARHMIPLGNSGLIHNSSVRDRFGLEFGADFISWDDSYYDHDYGWSELVPTCGVLWAVWVNPELAFYPKLDLGYAIGWDRGWDDHWGDVPHSDHDGFFWQGSIGMIYRFSSLALRLEAGNHLLKFGLGFGF